MADRPLILLSNDDGVHAAGLLALRRSIASMADVVVMAPEHEQSAHSHSITLSRPLRHRRLDDDLHALDGTPADCIYIALYLEGLLPRTPDLVVSGINHGPNLGSDVFYSGTVAAAREGALRGIPSIAFSLADPDELSNAAALAKTIACRLLESIREKPEPILLNVNFPSGPWRGIRATSLGRRLYDDQVTVRHDPRGREYYWVGGAGSRHELMRGSDTEAQDERYVSITPLMLDATCEPQLTTARYVADARLDG